MKKIAIINQRYGLEVNGGSEYYTRQIAERLSKYYQVDVITSKAKDYKTWRNFYRNEIDIINGVTVRRFDVKKERGFTFRIIDHIIRSFKFHPIWIEKKWVEEQGPYCPDAIKYLSDHVEEYKAIIFVTYLYYPTAMGLPKFSEKAIFVPTAHDEPFIYYSIYNEAFQKPKAIIYLTDEEKNFVNGLFRNECITDCVMGAGVELPSTVNEKGFREKYKIDGQYVIYVGRVDAAKGCDHMIHYFKQFIQKNSFDLKLVIIGQRMMEIEPDPNIICLGFVDEQDKFDGIKGANALLLPSEYESLSIAVLEALALGRPVIVNGKCEVLKGHCEKSQAGIAYVDYEGFCSALTTVLCESAYYEQMSYNAKKYIEENYCWRNIEEKYCELIEMVADGSGKE